MYRTPHAQHIYNPTGYEPKTVAPYADSNRARHRREKVPDSLIKVLPTFAYGEEDREHWLMQFTGMIRAISGEYLIQNELRRTSDGAKATIEVRKALAPTTGIPLTTFSPSRERDRQAI